MNESLPPKKDAEGVEISALFAIERIQALADGYSTRADQLDAEAEKAFKDKAPLYQSESVLKSMIFREAAYQCHQEIERIKAND